MQIRHHNGPHARGAVEVDSFEDAPKQVMYPFSARPVPPDSTELTLLAHVYALQSLRGGSQISWAYVYTGIIELGDFTRVQPVGQDEPTDQIGANGNPSDIVPDDDAATAASKQSRGKKAASAEAE